MNFVFNTLQSCVVVRYCARCPLCLCVSKNKRGANTKKYIWSAYMGMHVCMGWCFTKSKVTKLKKVANLDNQVVRKYRNVGFLHRQRCLCEYVFDCRLKCDFWICGVMFCGTRHEALLGMYEEIWWLGLTKFNVLPVGLAIINLSA